MDKKRYRTAPTVSVVEIQGSEVFRQVRTIHESQDTLNEIDRYLAKTGKSAGKAYVEAMHAMIARERDAGRWA